MKKVIIIIFTTLFILTGCKGSSYINAKDNIPDKDERLIKKFRSYQEYSNNELKNLDIRYLGTVYNYKIYYVPYKGENGGEGDWVQGGYIFPTASHTRIIGIKSNKLYVLGELIFEQHINIELLYKILPDEYKTR